MQSVESNPFSGIAWSSSTAITVLRDGNDIYVNDLIDSVEKIQRCAGEIVGLRTSV